MKLIKRSTDKLAPYYARFEVRGKAYWWSTKTEDKKLAESRAKAYRNAVVAGQFNLADSMKARQGGATFGEVLKEYLAFASPEETTRKTNAAALRLVLAASGFSETTTVDRTTAQLALKWQQVGRARGTSVFTINSRLRQARSVFSSQALASYTSELALPREAIRSFFDISPLKEPERRPELPVDAADKKAAATLPTVNPRAFRAYLLARYAGMRASEIKAANKNWFAGDILHIGGIPDEFVTKSRKWRAVRLPQPVIDTLLASDKDSLVGKCPKQLVDHTLPALLQSYGFPKKKPLHSLRRLFGSIVYTTQGPRQARDALGHANQATTDKHYARSLDAPAAITYVPVEASPLAPVVPMPAVETAAKATG